MLVKHILVPKLQLGNVRQGSPSFPGREAELPGTGFPSWSLGTRSALYSVLPTPYSQLRCYLVTKDADGNVSGEITERPLAELPDGEVLVRVQYSSLNYKDALAAKGHRSVNRAFPHVPGVDAAGTVAQSGAYEFVEGDEVLVTGFDMGSNRWGGFAEYVRVPQDWVVPLPEGLSLRESMMLGTAGLTAGFCVDALQKHDVRPDRGEVVVTGASGGVGSFARAKRPPTSTWNRWAPPKSSHEKPSTTPAASRSSPGAGLGLWIRSAPTPSAPSSDRCS